MEQTTVIDVDVDYDSGEEERQLQQDKPGPRSEEAMPVGAPPYPTAPSCTCTSLTVGQFASWTAGDTAAEALECAAGSESSAAEMECYADTGPEQFDSQSKADLVKLANDEEAFRNEMDALADFQSHSGKSIVMSPDKFDAIVQYLKNQGACATNVQSHFRSWIRSRGFRLMDFPDQNLCDVLVKPARLNKNTASAGGPDILTVLHARALYDVVKHVHGVVYEHGGYKRVLSYMQSHYFGVTRGYVQKFCSACPVCRPHRRRLSSYRDNAPGAFQCHDSSLDNNIMHDNSPDNIHIHPPDNFLTNVTEDFLTNPASEPFTLGPTSSGVVIDVDEVCGEVDEGDEGDEADRRTNRNNRPADDGPRSSGPRQDHAEREHEGRTGLGHTRTRAGTVTGVDNTRTTTATGVDNTRTTTMGEVVNTRTGTVTVVDNTRTITTTGVDNTRTTTTGEVVNTRTRTGTVIAVDNTRTGTVTGVDNTRMRTVTGVDNTRTRTVTSVDNTRTKTIVDGEDVYIVTLNEDTDLDEAQVSHLSRGLDSKRSRRLARASGPEATAAEAVGSDASTGRVSGRRPTPTGKADHHGGDSAHDDFFQLPGGVLMKRKSPVAVKAEPEGAGESYAEQPTTSRPVHEFSDVNYSRGIQRFALDSASIKREVNHDGALTSPGPQSSSSDPRDVETPTGDEGYGLLEHVQVGCWEQVAKAGEVGSLARSRKRTYEQTICEQRLREEKASGKPLQRPGTADPCGAKRRTVATCSGVKEPMPSAAARTEINALRDRTEINALPERTVTTSALPDRTVTNALPERTLTVAVPAVSSSTSSRPASPTAGRETRDVVVVVPEPDQPRLLTGFFSDLHVDIINMTQAPDNGFHYICHVADHSRKLHVLFPLERASASALAPALDQRVLAYYGMPKALHSNLGHGFVEELIAALLRIVEGGFSCVNGEAQQQQQQQGLADGAKTPGGTNVVEELIAMLRVERCANSPDGVVPWLSWLPRIMRSLNRDWHAALRASSSADAVAGRKM